MLYGREGRGIIYIRYGQPDDIIVIPKADGVSETSWLYNETRIHQRMIFYFMVDRDAPPGYWTLVPMLLDPEFLDDLEVWDSRYYHVDPRYRDTWDKLVREGVATAEEGLRKDTFNWPREIKPLYANISLTQFKEDANTNFLSLDYAVPLDELPPGLKTKDSVSFAVDISVFDSTMKLLFQKNDMYFIGSSNKHVYKGLFIDGNKFLLKTQKYVVSMDLRVPEFNLLYGSYFNISLTKFNRSLSCSMEQAFKITPFSSPDKRDRNHISILPNPTFRFDRSENVLTYYEIYNLSLDNSGNSNYSIDFDVHRKDNSKSIWDVIAGLFSSKSSYNISIQNNYNGNTRDVSNYIAFDISELQSGEYEMTLKVKDNLSGKETSASSGLAVK